MDEFGESVGEGEGVEDGDADVEWAMEGGRGGRVCWARTIR